MQKDYIGAVDEFYKNNENNLNSLTAGKSAWEAQNSRQKVDTVNSLLAELNEYVNDYKSLQNQLVILQVNLDTAKNINTINPILNRLSSIRNKIYTIGTDIRKEGSFGYPLNLYRCINGVKEEKYSGITGTIDFQWDSILSSYDSLLVKEINGRCSEITNMISGNAVFESLPASESAKKNVLEIQNYNNARIKILEANKKIISQESSRYDSYGSKADFYVLFSNLINEELDLWNTISKIPSENKNELQKPSEPANALRTGNDSYSENLVDSARNFISYSNIATVASKSDSYFKLKNSSEADTASNSFCSLYLSLCNKVELYTQNTSINLWIKAADFFADASSSFKNQHEAAYKKCSEYISSVETGAYSTRCIEEIDYILPELLQDRDIISKCRAKLNDGYAYRSNLILQQNTIESNDEILKSLYTNFESLYEKAKIMQVSATAALNEIMIFYDKAEEFYNKNNFDKSFENLSRSQNAYNQKNSELKNDVDVLNKIFNMISDLRTKIIDKERPIFLNEIRTLKSKARVEYYAGNFEEANIYITDADSKRITWAKLIDVELEEDSELERLKDYVTTALTVKEGREISDWDSKAPEMKKNLSSAKKLFSEGKKEYENNNKAEGEKLLHQAVDLINLIKIYYPRNKEASLLSLRIEQVLNKSTFEETFAAKCQALSKINFEDKSAASMQAYSDLLDLYELNPSYPGLKENISNAEVGLGLKQKPVSKTNNAQSDRYAQDAQKILNRAARDPILLQEAKELAKKAQELNPQNSQAITILDEIAFRTGEESAVTLSQKDEALYQEALTCLQKNDIIEASSKLNILLQTKGNERSAKIIKLKKRIEAQL